MRVREIWLYPIKSCRGFRVPSARVVRRGLERDRRWMLVGEDGVFLTQRRRPELTLLRCALEGDLLRVRAPNAPDLVMPIELAEGPRARVKVWDDEVDALVYEEASAWLAARLGAPCRAVFMPDDAERPTKRRTRDTDVIAFADAYPLLAIGQASLEALDARLAVAGAPPATMERFRPTIVFDGAPPHDEDRWVGGAIGDVPFRAGGVCVRCAVPSVDPETGARSTEPLATLATYRARGNELTFGVNLVHDGEGQIHVGDEIVVLPVPPQARSA